ncbi:MAG TPA: hypothetical protein PJ982_13490, partial [Lacipirellulaceae bacterium]|nr:hypothetical protein [Lacipirellulaceae bacterium]
MRRWHGILGAAAAWAMLAHQTPAAVTFNTTQGLDPYELDGMISNSDVLHGLIATEMPGDQGWPPVNPAAANSLHPWGLPAFTDGLGSQGNFYGLLNDFPPLGSPTKLLQYDLPGPTDVTEINIFTGNILDTDGRVFSTVVIRYSANNG